MIITLCGSTRFKDEFGAVMWQLGKAGYTVFGLSGFGREATDEGKPNDFPLASDEDKRRLDLVHLHKILLSDAVFVIDGKSAPVGNIVGHSYIGFSTLREIEWARMNNKRAYYLSRGDLPDLINKGLERFSL